MRHIVTLLSSLMVAASLISPLNAQEIDLTQAPKPIFAPQLVGTGGEYTTSVTIDLPKFRDMPVNVSLNYNSSDIRRSGVDKVVAFGWSLNAFSVIERKSLGGGVPTFDDGQDVYNIDGSELMACGDTAATNPWTRHYPLRYITDKASGSCTAGGNFVTRVDDNNRVQFDQATNTFVVTHPDGLRFTYKSIGELTLDTATDASLETQYVKNARWLLTQISDQQVQPNTVNYTYAFGPRTYGYPHRIAKISYGGYDVLFNYQDVAAQSVARFATGSTIMGQQGKKLRSIIVRDGLTILRGYQLFQTASTLTSTPQLTKVTQYGAGLAMTGADITSGPVLPSNTFTYSPDTVSFEQKTFPGKQFHESVNVLDWDRNGTDDLYLSPAPVVIPPESKGLQK